MAYIIGYHTCGCAKHKQDATPQCETGRPLFIIARDALDDTTLNGDARTYARPYLDAMLDLDNIHQSHGADSAPSVIAYALANLSSWRGDSARRIKSELTTIIGKG